MYTAPKKLAIIFFLIVQFLIIIGIALNFGLNSNTSTNESTADTNPSKIIIEETNEYIYPSDNVLGISDENTEESLQN